MYMLVFRQLAIMLAIAVVGFLFARKNKFGNSVPEFLSKLLLFVINPCVIVNSFNEPFDGEKMRQFLVVFAISMAVHFLLAVIATVSLRSRDGPTQRTNDLDRLAVVFTNCGFIGIPLINGIYGAEGVFLLMGYLTAYNIAFWTYGVFLMERRVKIRNIFLNPNIAAVAFGLILFCLPVRLPALIVSITAPIASMNAAGAMILLGMLFAAFSESGEGIRRHARRLVRAGSLRLLVSPVFALALLWVSKLAFGGFADIRKMLFVVFIAAAGPVGMNISGFAVLYKRDSSYSSVLVLATSALCIVTLPLFVALAEYVL